jgi:hypothetical protein
MKCPKCSHFIPPYRVWLISRWTFVKCDNCGSQFGRKLDLQLFGVSSLLFLGWIVPFILILNYFISHPEIQTLPLDDVLVAILLSSLVCALFWSPLVMLADAATIHLVPMEKKH